MTPDTPDLPNPEDSGARADGAPEAPKRKPRARKTVVADAAAPEGAAAENAPAPVAADAPAEEAAPRPKRRTRKAEAPAGEEAAAAPSSEASPAPVPAPVVHEPSPRFVAEAAAPAAASTGAGAEASGERAEGDAERTGEPGAGAAAEGDGEGRRSRNRRRRRRGRNGGAEGAAEGGAEGGVRAEGEGDAEGDDADGDSADGDRDRDEEGAERSADGPPRADHPPRPPRPQRPLAPPIEFDKADVAETFGSVLSGVFDVEAEVVEGQPSIPAKRVLAPEPDAPKLHKVLAQSGIGSRRDMEQLIADGKVQVNGETAHTGQRISFGDEVRVAGRVVKLRIAPPAARVLAYHKPAGEIVTMDDPQNRPTVFRRLPRLQNGKWQAVGRLDLNTEGLLLLTNSGDLANKLMHPRFGVEREYAVRVLGELNAEQRERLCTGVQIDGQEASFKSIEDGGGEGANRWYRVVITEGRNREVRKLFDSVGMAVSRLIRIRYGSVVLPRGLKRGVWVDLDESDVRRLRQLAGDTHSFSRDDEPRDAVPARVPQPAPGQGQGQGPGKGPKPRMDDRKDRGGPTPRKDRPKERDRERPPRDRERPVERDRAVTAVQLEPGDPRNIPNPLIQTFDRRAMQQRERPVVYDETDDENIGPIPNPLQQTYDKRFVKEQRGPGGPGGRGGKHGKGGGGGGQPKQPDPMQTAVGYIGADTFIKKLHSRGGGGGGGGGGGRGRR
jgi:23S rRNA pseudouridine2605 synthase